MQAPTHQKSSSRKRTEAAANAGEVVARDYRSGRVLQVRWVDGRIESVRPVHHRPRIEQWIAPGLADLQINGYAGVDFQQDHLTLEQLELAVESLARDGCTRFFATLITDDWTRMMARLTRLRELRARSAALRHAIAGWHIEGPFLSSEPGFCGAHDPQFMIDPRPEHLRELRRIVGDDPLLLTFAPERAGALQTIQRAAKMGIVVSLGHTDASRELLARAVEAGASGFTHLGNGCPKLLDRHDNILWRVFETKGLTVSLIPDEIHVSPALFRIAFRQLTAGRIYFTTDAMAAAGAPPGEYSLGRKRLRVGPDQIVREPGKTNFAGSALAPIDGVIRAARMLDVRWQDVWDHFCRHPLELVRLPSPLRKGQPADFCLIREDSIALAVEMIVSGQPRHTTTWPMRKN
ncbi:MAG: N-acetylglucosamine-6-phosphate deacetylase [Verrucomicrobiota bacterium]